MMHQKDAANYRCGTQAASTPGIATLAAVRTEYVGWLSGRDITTTGGPHLVDVRHLSSTRLGYAGWLPCVSLCPVSQVDPQQGVFAAWARPDSMASRAATIICYQRYLHAR